MTRIDKSICASRDPAASFAIVGENAHPTNDSEHRVSRLAKRTIDRRLRRVARLLPRAAKKPEEDVEYVHDLRVSVRRAAAALQLFAPFLPRSAHSQMISQLRSIRGAAGRARDLDVLEERLSQLAVAGGTSTQLAAAIDRIRRDRLRAQKPLLKVYKRASKQDFKRRIRDLSARVRWRGHGAEPELRDWAGAALRPALDRFAARSSGDLSDLRALHRMRIAEKRVRYSLELLDGSTGSTAHRAAPVLKELQERLGEINDHDTARALLLRWRDKSKSQGLREVFCYLAAFEKRSCSNAHDQFLEWWTPNRKSDLHEQINAILDAIGCREPPASAGDTKSLSNLTSLR